MCKNLLVVAFVSLFIVIVVYVNSIDCELYEGSKCLLETGHVGVCKKLPDCPPRAQEVRDGMRTATSAGRCGFDDFVEIVCCPLNIRSGPREAELACSQYRDMEFEETDSESSILVHSGIGVARHEFPFMAALGYENKDLESDPSPIKYDCGGSLISLQHILTAAHCVVNIDERAPVEVLLGAHSLRSKEKDAQRIKISDIKVHPQYKRSKSYNDVAILKLQTRVRLTTACRPACVYSKPVNLTASDSPAFLVAGWGATDLENDRSEILLKSPLLNLASKEECNKPYVGFLKLPRGIDDTMICTIDSNSTRSADACSGDSGGPLLMYSKIGAVIVGITAFGKPCGSYVPGVYTAVYPFLDWIDEVVWSNDRGEYAG